MVGLMMTLYVLKSCFKKRHLKLQTLANSDSSHVNGFLPMPVSVQAFWREHITYPYEI